MQIEWQLYKRYLTLYRYKRIYLREGLYIILYFSFDLIFLFFSNKKNIDIWV